MQAEEALKKVEQWLGQKVKEKGYGSITISHRPGNPDPHISIEKKETEQ